MGNIMCCYRPSDRKTGGTGVRVLLRRSEKLSKRRKRIDDLVADALKLEERGERQKRKRENRQKTSNSEFSKGNGREGGCSEQKVIPNCGGESLSSQLPDHNGIAMPPSPIVAEVNNNDIVLPEKDACNTDIINAEANTNAATVICALLHELLHSISIGEIKEESTQSFDERIGYQPISCVDKVKVNAHNTDEIVNKFKDTNTDPATEDESEVPEENKESVGENIHAQVYDGKNSDYNSNIKTTDEKETYTIVVSENTEHGQSEDGEIVGTFEPDQIVKCDTGSTVNAELPGSLTVPQTNGIPEKNENTDNDQTENDFKGKHDDTIDNLDDINRAETKEESYNIEESTVANDRNDDEFHKTDLSRSDKHDGRIVNSDDTEDIHEPNDENALNGISGVEKLTERVKYDTNTRENVNQEDDEDTEVANLKSGEPNKVNDKKCADISALKTGEDKHMDKCDKILCVELPVTEEKNTNFVNDLSSQISDKETTRTYEKAITDLQIKVLNNNPEKLFDGKTTDRNHHSETALIQFDKIQAKGNAIENTRKSGQTYLDKLKKNIRRVELFPKSKSITTKECVLKKSQELKKFQISQENKQKQAFIPPISGLCYDSTHILSALKPAVNHTTLQRIKLWHARRSANQNQQRHPGILDFMVRNGQKPQLKDIERVKRETVKYDKKRKNMAEEDKHGSLEALRWSRHMRADISKDLDTVAIGNEKYKMIVAMVNGRNKSLPSPTKPANIRLANCRPNSSRLTPETIQSIRARFCPGQLPSYARPTPSYRYNSFTRHSPPCDAHGRNIKPEMSRDSKKKVALRSMKKQLEKCCKEAETKASRGIERVTTPSCNTTLSVGIGKRSGFI